MLLHLLGTGAGASDADRTTTMLAIECDDLLVLVDCGGDAARAVQRSGLDPVAIDAVVLTHEHPDHISGFPLLVEKMWLLGRRAPIDVYGPAPTLAVARQLFALFDTERWEGLPPLVWHPVDLSTRARVLHRPGFELFAYPVLHPVPTIGLRAEAGGAVLAYTCDTGPSPLLAPLADGADLLVHEATGHIPGVHSSVEDACDLAVEVGVDRVVLVHAPVGACEDDLDEARRRVRDIRWGTDGDRFSV